MCTRRGIKAALSGRGCLAAGAGFLLSGASLIGLLSHQHTDRHAPAHTHFGQQAPPTVLDASVPDGNQRELTWEASEASVAEYMAHFNARWADTAATARAAKGPKLQMVGGVSAPRRWLIQNLLAAVNDIHRPVADPEQPLLSLERHGSTTARLLASEEWVRVALPSLPPRRPTATAFRFNGVVLHPVGGLDLIGMLTTFPDAACYWIVSEHAFGRIDMEFWGVPDVSERRAQVDHDLRDFVGPHGWLPSATELRYSLHSGNAHTRQVSVGIFPTILALLTIGGYDVESVVVDHDKSVPQVDGGLIKTHRITFHPASETTARGRRRGRRELLYTEVNRTSRSVHPVADKVAAFLLHSGDPLAVHLVGGEHSLLEEVYQPFRQLVTRVAAVVVQDDAGLPFVELASRFSVIDPWGDYIGPQRLAYLNASSVSAVVQLGLVEYFRVEKALGTVGRLPLGETGFRRWDIRSDRGVGSDSPTVLQCLLFASRSVPS
mmetsp:Transcript_26225/g.68882  ORF Transcript_26225/g.68882 Transcript_26225/m.68882 type:complete len:492 (+) Transcript_26225:120-1595(+)